jgi:cytochrome c oxidase cbb3-type subunit I/II
MFSDTLSKLHFWGWQLIIVSAALTLPFGITQGKEYAELEWPIDLAIAVVWVGFFGVNFFGTLAKRRERHMYVALWFYIATIVTVAMLHVFNNIWIPAGIVHWFNTGEAPSAELLMKSYPVYAGVQDALMQWWYGHNAVAFFLTTPFLGLMYYFLPKAAEKPVFSYRLSILHFWSLVFIYIWAGPHHLHYTALPEWASTLGMLFSVMLWMPSWGGMINGLLTLRGAWHKVAQDPVLKFFVVGITFYGMSTFEGPLLSVKIVNSAQPLHGLDHRPRARRRARVERVHDLRDDVLAVAAAVPDQALEPEAGRRTSGSGRSASCSTSSRSTGGHHAGPDVAGVR